MPSSDTDTELLAATEDRPATAADSFDPDERAPRLQPVVAVAIFASVGAGIAVGISAVATDHHQTEKKFEMLAKYQLQWLYFSAWLLSALTRYLNFYPGGLKSAAMAGRAKGNMRANMYLFKVMVDHPGDKQLPLVIMEEDGAAGRYNRGNRSLHHFVENSLSFFLCVPLAGFAFPVPSFVCTVIFTVGRLLHQIRYSDLGYGAHAPGFIVTALASAVIEGLVLVAGVQALLAED